MRRLMFLLSAAAVLTACGAAAATSPAATPTLTPATQNRPPSPVRVTLVSPTNGEVVHGSVVHVVVSISGGTVTKAYSTNISPTVGHVHLYMNNQLVYMTYTLHQDMPVNPGVEYTMYAEWVAADHFPFSPRDVTPRVFFTVAAS
ncbi:MAG: hypothetical protein JOY80_08695 [Candidatus Dormibacteraeota bacterium]|nr:hypothetical protein [Candidatus Dormibacteraeota bacterium]